MRRFANLVPLVTAIISATALLGGYMYQKHMEKNAEIRTTRQDIYSRLIANITKRNEILGRVEMTPEWKKAKKNPQEQHQLELKNTELSENEGDRTEIVSLLCLYGTDDAVKAYFNYAKENLDPKGQGGDLGKLILALRRSIYPKTHTTAKEANLAIWYDAKYLNKSSQAR